MFYRGLITGIFISALSVVARKADDDMADLQYNDALGSKVAGAVLMPFAYLLPPTGLGLGKCPASFLC